jgi:quercetin dioxygenase-like cupin family protein
MSDKSINSLPSLHVPGRILDNNLLVFNLPEEIEKIKLENTWEKGERDAITLMKSSNMSIVLIALHDKMEMNFRQTNNLISVQLIEGKMNFQTEKQSGTLNKGSLLALHEDLQHTLIAIEKSIFLLTIAVCHPLLSKNFNTSF